jgi:ribosomal subunit interface protein
MKLPLQITFHGLDRSPALEAAIEEKAAKLEQFHPSIIGCRVTVTQESRHHAQGRLVNVRIDLTVPDRELAITNKQHEDAFVAVREAFDAARRVLQDALALRRGDVKNHAGTG